MVFVAQNLANFSQSHPDIQLLKFLKNYLVISLSLKYSKFTLAHTLARQASLPVNLKQPAAICTGTWFWFIPATYVPGIICPAIHCNLVRARAY